MDQDLEQSIRHDIDDLVNSVGVVSSLTVDENAHIVCILEVDADKGAMLEDARQKIEAVIAARADVKGARVILTAKRKAAQPAKPAPDPHGMNKNPPVDVPAKHIIVVASGKGGVGKSTVSANIAAYLANRHQMGLGTTPLKVGLLDADIYGPSQPLMMGDEAYKPALDDNKRMIPMERHNLKIMSIGFVTDQSKALIWRGPMVQTAFYQMLRDVAWGSADDMLDYLIIDLPPGTGDVQLTLAQKVKASGAVIVSTPQDIALIDARRAVSMFETTHIPVLGLVENMSVYHCPKCGHEEHIFGEHGGRNEAQAQGVPFLGAIPLQKHIRLQSDLGRPVVLDDGAGSAFATIAEAIIADLA